MSVGFVNYVLWRRWETQAKLLACSFKFFGEKFGKGGIRTHGTLSRTHAFEACTLNRSVTFPLERQKGVILLVEFVDANIKID